MVALLLRGLGILHVVLAVIGIKFFLVAEYGPRGWAALVFALPPGLVLYAIGEIVAALGRIEAQSAANSEQQVQRLHWIAKELQKQTKFLEPEHRPAPAGRPRRRGLPLASEPEGRPEDEEAMRYLQS